MKGQMKKYTVINGERVIRRIAKKTEKLIFNGYEYHFRKNYKSSKHKVNFRVYYCSSQRQGKCRMSIREITHEYEGGRKTYQYFLSHGDHSHRPHITPPSSPVQIPYFIDKVKPYDIRMDVYPIGSVFFRVNRNILKNFLTNLKSVDIILTDQYGRSISVLVVRTEMYPIRNQPYDEGEIMFRIPRENRLSNGHINVTLKLTSSAYSQPLRPTKENVFVFTQSVTCQSPEQVSDSPQQRNEQQHNPNKRPRIEDVDYFSRESKLIHIWPGQGHVSGGQHNDLYFNLTRHQYYERLVQRRELPPRFGCHFGNVPASSISRRIEIVEDYHGMDHLQKSDVSLYEKLTEDAKFVMKVITPPSEKQIPGFVDVTLHTGIENLTLINGYEYTDESEKRSKSMSSTNSVSDEDESGLFGFGNHDDNVNFGDDSLGFGKDFMSMFGENEDDYVISQYSMKKVDGYGANLLFYAVAKLNQFKNVKLLIEKYKFSVIEKDILGLTVFDVAIHFKKFRILKYLMFHLGKITDEFVCLASEDDIEEDDPSFKNRKSNGSSKKKKKSSEKEEEEENEPAKALRIRIDPKLLHENQGRTGTGRRKGGRKQRRGRTGGGKTSTRKGGKSSERREEHEFRFSKTTINDVIVTMFENCLGEFRDGIHVKDLSIQFDGTFISRSLTLIDAGIRAGQIVNLTSIPKTVERANNILGVNPMSVTGGMTIQFIPMEGYDGVRSIETNRSFRPDGPSHRRWGKGMNIECVCPDSACQMSQVKQVIPLGFGVFNIVDVFFQTKCSQCGKKIFTKDTREGNFKRIGFTYCYFRYTYYLVSGEEGGSENWIMAPYKPAWLDGDISGGKSQSYYKVEFEVITMEEYKKRRKRGEIKGQENVKKKK